MSNKATGIKHDQSKPDMALISSIAMVEVARVMTFGKTKYSAHNWRGGLNWSRCLAAALRHIFSFLGGEDKDPETGISHIAHAACCLMFILEYQVTHPELDDRFKGVEQTSQPLPKASSKVTAEAQEYFTSMTKTPQGFYRPVVKKKAGKK